MIKASLKDLKDQLRTGRDALHTVQNDGGDQEEGGKLSTVYLLAFFPPESRSSFLHCKFSLQSIFFNSISLRHILYLAPSSFLRSLYLFLSHSQTQTQAGGRMNNERTREFWPTPAQSRPETETNSRAMWIKDDRFPTVPAWAGESDTADGNPTHENSGARRKKKTRRQQMDLFTSGMSCHPLSKN